VWVILSLGLNVGGLNISQRSGFGEQESGLNFGKPNQTNPNDDNFHLSLMVIS
jgi:hypothetical protein